MCKLDRIHLHSIVHHWRRVDRASCKTDKLCWYYNGHNLIKNNLSGRVSKG